VEYQGKLVISSSLRHAKRLHKRVRNRGKKEDILPSVIVLHRISHSNNVVASDLIMWTAAPYSVHTQTLAALHD
jgi:hypothetical protein